MSQHVCILATPGFVPGDLPPASGGYLETHAWAEVQIKAGLKQVECGRCAKHKFPQELSDQVLKWKATYSAGLQDPICNACADSKE